MKLIRFFCLSLLASACIEPFDIKLTETQTQVVVDGEITDQPGPYTVRLSQAINIDNQISDPGWIRGASVSIFDDQGTTENLIEKTPGNYQTASIQGVVGRSYYIQVRTADGGNYQSAPEKLLPVGDFSNLHYEFVENEAPTTANSLNTTNGFNINLDASILPEQNGLVRWRWTGTFQIMTYPELKKKAVSRAGVTVILPDPPLCSGYIVYPNPNTITRVADCTCCNCWISQFNEVPLLSDKQFVVNNKVTNYNIAFIEANRRYLFSKYYLQVEQMSVSQTVYDFWKKVLAQQQSGSDLFQTPPAATGGNISATSSGAAPVVGIFVAASIKTRVIVIDRSDLPANYILQAIDTIPTSCAEVYRNSTTVKPAFW